MKHVLLFLAGLSASVQLPQVIRIVMILFLLPSGMEQIQYGHKDVFHFIKVCAIFKHYFIVSVDSLTISIQRKKPGG